ncbi:MAG: hypothetical protein RLY13_410, partial [Actinomycetota bacterium]
MVKKKDTDAPEKVVTPTRARATKKTTETADEKPAKKVTKKAPASIDEVVEKAKKAPAKRSTKAKAEAEKAPTEAAVKPATASATSLMFMAPDLPTPKVSGKGIAKEKPSDESHLRRRSRRRAGEAVDVDPNVAPNTVVK